MKFTNNKNKFLLSMIMMVFIIGVFPFSMAVNDKTPDKINIEHEKYGGNFLFKDFNKYKNEYIEVNSDIKNTLDIDNAIFNKNYISVGKYKKNKENSPYELKFFTNNTGVKYTLYKSDLVGVSKRKVKETANIKIDVESVNGYVYYNTSSFSTVILSMPDVTIPFYNIYSIDLRQYFGDVDHYGVYYDEPVSPFAYLELDEGYPTAHGDYWDLNLYRDGGNAFLDIYMYETICYNTNCSGLTPELQIFAYDDAGETSYVTETFYIGTPHTYTYYKNPRSGLMEDMTFYADFNYNKYLTNGETYQRFNTDTPFTVSGATLSSDGIFNSSYDFNGIDEYINVSDFSLSGSGSVSFWFNLDTVSGYQLLDTSSISDGINIQIFSNKIYARIDGASFLIGPAVSPSTWYHVVFTWDGTDHNLYVNAGSPSTQSSSVQPTTTSRSVLIGVSSGSTAYVNGKLDEFSIYDKALTDDEISFIYNSGFGHPFHAHNHPSLVGFSGFCWETYYGCGYTDMHELGNIQIGVYDIYLSNYVTFPLSPLSESFNVTTRNFDASLWETITNGQCTAYGGIYDVCLAGDKLSLEFYGNSGDETGFDAPIYVTNSLGDIQTLYWSVEFPVTSNLPPEQTTPLPILTFNVSETNDTNSLNINSYVSNYENIILELVNENINITMDRDGSSVYTYEDEIKITLDPTDVSNNIIVNISEIDGNYYIGRINFYFNNSNSSIMDFIDISIQPPFTYTFFNETLGFNDTYFYIFDNEGHIDSDEIERPYNTISNIEISFSGVGLGEGDTDTYYLNSSSIVGEDCSLSLIGVIPGSLQWLNIQVFCSDYNSVYWIFNEEDENYIFIGLTNDYLETGGYALQIVSGLDNITLKDFSMSVTDGFGTYSGNFYINVNGSYTASTSESLETDYDSLKVLFMVEDDAHKPLYALVFIAIFITIGILFIGVKLRFNGLSLILIYIIGMLATFVMCWVEYIEWAYFVVPLLFGVVYGFSKLIGGFR